nr:hypothetical protein CTI12_AA122510 [Tanacetum cinerariifolium]
AFYGLKGDGSVWGSSVGRVLAGMVSGSGVKTTCFLVAFYGLKGDGSVWGSSVGRVLAGMVSGSGVKTQEKWLIVSAGKKCTVHRSLVEQTSHTCRSREPNKVDEDLGFQYFNPRRYLDIVKAEGLEISWPAVYQNSTHIHHYSQFGREQISFIGEQIGNC